jgi:hypothetical protein
MTRPTITLDATLFEVALDEITDALAKSPTHDLPRRTAWALGVLRSIATLRVEPKAASSDTSEPFRREVELLSAAIKRAGFRIDRFDTLSGCELALYPVAHPAKPLAPGPRTADDTQFVNRSVCPEDFPN